MTAYARSNMIWQQNTVPFPENKADLCTTVPAQHVHASEVIQSDASWQRSNVGFIYEKKKKRLKDAKSITLGVCALRCHLLHVNQQWSRRGWCRGGLRDLIVKNCQRSKSFNSSHYTIHRLPSLYIPWITKGPVWKTKLPLQCFLTAIIVWCIISKSLQSSSWCHQGTGSTPGLCSTVSEHLIATLLQTLFQTWKVRYGIGFRRKLQLRGWKLETQMWCFRGSVKLPRWIKSSSESGNNMELAISGTRTHRGLIWVGGSGIIYDALSQG